MILVLNCGSQSIKWKVFDKRLRVKGEGKRDVFDKKGFRTALRKELKSIKQDIDVVGHRVVHGGDRFIKPIKVDLKVLKEYPEAIIKCCRCSFLYGTLYSTNDLLFAMGSGIVAIVIGIIVFYKFQDKFILYV